MKNIFLFFLTFATFISCEKEPEIAEYAESTYYKITEFKISDKSVDLNNDKISHSDMFLEFENYFKAYDSDLILKKRSQFTLYSFYIPTQYIYYDYNCCPDGAVEFAKGGFTEILGNNQTILEDELIETGVRIVSFRKIDNSSFKLLLEKEYYDFSIKRPSSYVYEIKYEIKK